MKKNVVNGLSCAAAALAMAMLAGGCASTGNLAELESRNAELETALALEKERAGDLERKLDTLKGINQTLQKEKGVRVQESTELRGQVRSYVQREVEYLRDFSQNAELLDYFGSEPMDREKTAGEDLLLVDMKSPFNTPTTVIGGKVYSKGKAKVLFCLLRPKGSDLVIVWMSKVFNLPKEGLSKLSFDAPVAAQTGDFIGLYCPGRVTVPFDVGTGDTRILNGRLEVGQVISMSLLSGTQYRSYSFGAVGFMD